MSKTFAGIMLILVIAILFPGISHAADVTGLNELVENGKAFDGKAVTVQGEALGEAMERGGYAWVNISDPTNIMGIWMKKEDAEKIAFFGDYKHKGDIIRVSGIFHRACKEHGGDTDIHSVTVEVTEKGHPIKEKVDAQKLTVGIVLTIITLVIAGYYLKKIRISNG
ncbi:MAG: DNA-binding protein [Ruminiclostridium sp.]|nr:DNA-binding protein [Ruminiclostridium sp.]